MSMGIRLELRDILLQGGLFTWSGCLIGISRLVRVLLLEDWVSLHKGILKNVFLGWFHIISLSFLCEVV